IPPSHRADGRDGTSRLQSVVPARAAPAHRLPDSQPAEPRLGLAQHHPECSQRPHSRRTARRITAGFFPEAPMLAPWRTVSRVVVVLSVVALRAAAQGAPLVVVPEATLTSASIPGSGLFASRAAIHGNTVAALGLTPTNLGMVFVFTRSGGIWSEAQQLVPPP